MEVPPGAGDAEVLAPRSAAAAEGSGIYVSQGVFAGNRNRGHFSDVQFCRRIAVAAAAGSRAEPDRGVTTSTGEIFANTALSYPDYRHFRDGNRSFDGLLAASGAAFGFKVDAKALPKIAYGMFASGNFFHALGVQPVLGRAFLETEGI